MRDSIRERLGNGPTVLPDRLEGGVYGHLAGDLAHTRAVSSVRRSSALDVLEMLLARQPGWGGDASGALPDGHIHPRFWGWVMAPGRQRACSPRCWLRASTYFADRGMQLSRGFRALRVWMSMKEQGVARIGAAIGRNIDQAQRLARLVAEHPQLELMPPVPMNTVCFWYVGDGDRALDLDPINQEIVATLQVHGVAVPSQTILDHGFAIRVCITNHRSEDSDFHLLVDEVVRIGSRLHVDALSAG